jgi:hypothetical protein
MTGSWMIALEPYTTNLGVQLNGWQCWLVALEPYTPSLGVQLIALQYWLIALQTKNIHPHAYGVFLQYPVPNVVIYKRDPSCETGW